MGLAAPSPRTSSPLSALRSSGFVPLLAVREKISLPQNKFGLTPLAARITFTFPTGQTYFFTFFLAWTKDYRGANLRLKSTTTNTFRHVVVLSLDLKLATAWYLLQGQNSYLVPEVSHFSRAPSSLFPFLLSRPLPSLPFLCPTIPLFILAL